MAIKILYFIEGTGGGAVTHVLNLAKYMLNGMIQPLVIFFLDGPSVKRAEDLGLNYKLIPWKFSLDPTLIWRLWKTISEEKIDIVHSHTITGNFYARIAALLCPRSLISVTTVHSLIIDELRGSPRISFKDRLRYLREKCTWGVVDHFITVSEAIKSRMLQSGIPERKITVVNNGVELPDLSWRVTYEKFVKKELNAEDGEVIISIIGRLVPVKNHRLFLNAAKSVLEKSPKAKFLVVGDGPLLHTLKEETRKLGISKAVIFTGWLHDVQKILSVTDIYVICSTVEGLNISVLEAMASGKPVVGTAVRGISDIVLDNKTGTLVPPNDVDALAKAILNLVENKELRRSMGLMGRRTVERKYSIQKMTEETVEVYSKLFYRSRGSLHAE